jgi:hypothetical protein
MGANAVTSVYDYTAGQILTAAQMDNVNCGIPVFATTTTRDAAFGGTGEKVLAQGQYAYIEATSSLMVYTGSSWATVNASGLVLVKTQAVGTAVSTVAVTGAFSTDYDNYLITYNNGVGSGTGALFTMVLGSTTTGYYYSFIGANYNTTPNAGGSANTSNWGYIGTSDSAGSSLSVSVQSPFLTKRTTFSSNSPFANTSTSVQALGMLDNATSYTGFTLGVNTGTMTGGTIRVYGYVNS